MAHRKETYEVAGHEVTIQQVRGPDSDHGATDPSAWIDGNAVYENDALDYVPIDVSGLDKWDSVKRLVAFMVDNDVYFCKQCNTFYDYRDKVRTHFAGHICGDCARSNAKCPDNPNGDGHEDTCLNPRQKRNARVPTKYKCKHCGRKRQTTPTG